MRGIFLGKVHQSTEKSTRSSYFTTAVERGVKKVLYSISEWREAGWILELIFVSRSKRSAPVKFANSDVCVCVCVTAGYICSRRSSYYIKMSSLHPKRARLVCVYLSRLQ